MINWTIAAIFLIEFYNSLCSCARPCEESPKMMELGSSAELEKMFD